METHKLKIGEHIKTIKVSMGCPVCQGIIQNYCPTAADVALRVHIICNPRIQPSEPYDYCVMEQDCIHKFDQADFDKIKNEILGGE